MTDGVCVCYQNSIPLQTKSKQMINMQKRYNIITFLMTLLLSSSVFAQQVTLGNAIQIAQENSLDAKSAHFSFLASYWTYRSFKAELLPSVNLSGGLMNYNRSLVEARNYFPNNMRRTYSFQRDIH